jgi:hypothetical protein
MPQCQFPVFCYFWVSEKLHRKYSQNWTKRPPKLLFFLDEGQGPKESRRGARGQPHHEGAWPRPWPLPPMVRSPWFTPDDAPSPIRSIRMKNPKTFGKFPERVLQLRCRHRQILGDRSLYSGTRSGRGSALGAISIGLHHRLRHLHQSHRHLHLHCCLL